MIVFSLQPNPIIEEFHTRADFNLPVDGDESTDVDKWSEKCLPKYRRVFNCLKSVNPAIVLILSATYYHRDLTLNVRYLNRLVEIVYFLGIY